MPKKWKRCVKKVKAKQPKRCRKSPKSPGCYNAYAICSPLRGSHRSGSYGRRRRKIHTGPRGGRYYKSKNRKVYI